MFLDNLFSFFHKKNKTQVKAVVTPPIESSPFDSKATSETQSTSYVSNEVPVSIPPPLPQVEFEESRNLLQLDFFGSDKEQSLASFPKFDYLLQPTKEIDCTSMKKPHKSSTTLRHRISLYRPSSKTIKRSLSTPDIYNKQ